VTKMENRLGLPFTYPPGHWTHQAEPPEWLWGWPWDESVPASQAEVSMEPYPETDPTHSDLGTIVDPPD
jgi:hypothetical protein